MNLLLDTHVFLWFISGDKRISDEMQQSIRDPENAVYLSVVSLWETIIKYQLGKLPLPETPKNYFPLQRDKHQIASLARDEASVSQLAELPSLHRDPFDRMLICQAIAHNLTLMTFDEQIQAYSVSLWS